jgi:hypothetical protein
MIGVSLKHHRKSVLTINELLNYWRGQDHANTQSGSRDAQAQMLPQTGHRETSHGFFSRKQQRSPRGPNNSVFYSGGQRESFTKNSILDIFGGHIQKVQ